MTEQQLPNIPWEQTLGYVCAGCGHNIFTSKIMIRKVSRFIVGGDQDIPLPIDIIVCDSCGETAKDLIPSKLRNILFPNVPTD